MGGAPLEQAQRVVVGCVTVVRVVGGLRVGAGVREHPQCGFSQGGHESNLHSVAGDAVDLRAAGDDGGRLRQLRFVQRERGSVPGPHLQGIGHGTHRQTGGGGGAGAVRGRVQQHCHAKEHHGEAEQGQGEGGDGELSQHERP
ncbi:hypothetical protein [Bifidobacterium psychraerophilum]|uniref:hypothetical protein n=1 Tax=Bifidobacterium psychraerophilum TaxID=218140 RepID=UPI001930CF1B|nr:hypothetical protein [Bifidobacterium psychraerophilum]